MKRILLLLTASNVLTMSAVLAVNDVGTFYVVFKEQKYNQTDTSIPVLGNNGYRFTSRISAAAGGTLTGGTITPPNTGSVKTAQAYTQTNDGTGSLQFQQKFTTLSALNGAFGDGSYSLQITGQNGNYNSQLTVSGGTYPGEIPQVSNTNFSNGALLVDPRKAFTVIWNSFADHGANDTIVFSISDANKQTVMLQILAPTATSQVIPANTLQPLKGYTINLIFLKVNNLNTTSIPSSTGYGGYATTTNINISTPVEGFLNISTRGKVGTGEDILDGGIIITGFDAHRVIIRARGPVLSQFGVQNVLADPTLELHDNTGALIAKNDDWQTTEIFGIITADQVSEIQNSGLAPTDPSESAIIATLSPGGYTAIVVGKNGATGVALVEAFQLEN
jgi:hypothetical protein